MNNIEVKNSTDQKNPQLIISPSFTAFSGPVPPPNYLIEYDRICPGISIKFLNAPHEEAEHRRKLELLIAQQQLSLYKRGQWMAFILANVCIIAAFVTIFLGYDVAGLGALLISASLFAGVFIYKNKGAK